MTMHKACYGCTKRYLACHDHCAEYIRKQTEKHYFSPLLWLDLNIWQYFGMEIHLIMVRIGVRASNVLNDV